MRDTRLPQHRIFVPPPAPAPSPISQTTNSASIPLSSPVLNNDNSVIDLSSGNGCDEVTKVVRSRPSRRKLSTAWPANFRLQDFRRLNSHSLRIYVSRKTAYHLPQLHLFLGCPLLFCDDQIPSTARCLFGEVQRAAKAGDTIEDLVSCLAMIHHFLDGLQQIQELPNSSIIDSALQKLALFLHILIVVSVIDGQQNHL